MKTLGLALTLENYGLSQVRNFGFNSMFRLGDKTFAVNETGLYELGGDTDDGAQIDAYFDTRLVDLEVEGRLRNIYFGYESEGPLLVSVTFDESNSEEYHLPRYRRGQFSQSGRFRVQRKQVGRYYKIRVANVGGADFSVDMIEALPVPLGRKPRG